MTWDATHQGLVTMLVAVVSWVVSGKVNGKDKLKKTEHDQICDLKLKPINDKLHEISEDVKQLLRQGGCHGERTRPETGFEGNE